MNVSLKNYVLSFFIFVLSLCSFSFILEGRTLAIEIFADGAQQYQIDINTPTDSYFGGYDSGAAAPPVSIPSTDLSIITLHTPLSTVDAVFGGGRSAAGVAPNTITGNVRLAINHVQANGIYGGSLVNGASVVIGGNIQMYVSNANANQEIFGGHAQITPGFEGSIRSIELRLTNVQTPLVYSAGDVPGPAPNHTAIQEDIEIIMFDSRITDFYLVSRMDNVNVGGNVSLGSTNSQINRLIATVNSRIGGTLNINLENTRVNTNIILTQDGSIGGDVTLILKDSFVGGTLHLGPIGTAQIGGPVNLTAQNSTIGTLIAGPTVANGNINEININIVGGIITDLLLGPEDGTTVTVTANTFGASIDTFTIGGNGGITENATATINEGTIQTLSLGGDGLTRNAAATLNNVNVDIAIIGGNGALTQGTIDINNSTIDTCMIGGRGQAVTLATTNLNTGSINRLSIGGLRRQITTAVVNISQGFSINTITLGSLQQNGNVGVAILNIEGGDINEIITGHADNATINFEPWNPSYVRNGISGPGMANNINIQKHARTHWGTPGNTFPVKTGNFLFAGELFIPDGATVALNMEGNFIADGGIVIPSGSLATLTNPLLQFSGGTGSNLVLNQPLTVILSFAPEFLGKKNIPLASTTSPAFANANLFAAQNRKSIIWSDTIFNPSDNTWYLTNIRASEDFYGFSAAREATSWLREQHVWSIQRRSSQLLDHGVDGLWVNLQGGYEKLDAAIGEAKMPWVMASMGYDHIHNLPSISSKAIYGFGIGASKGDNKWSTINTTKNNIIMGMVAGYAGLMHNSGVYGTLTAQFAAGSITTKCTGFSKNYKWKEMIPTEAVELGWQHTFESGFKINPRGQVICEQLAKNHFKLPYENDTATLDKSFLITAVAGLAGEYNFQTSIPLNLQASVDYIKGVSGDFAAKSSILKITFKDKNDSNIIRTSLGINSQLRENLSIQCNVFADLGDDKGVGGQLGATYTF